MKQNKKYKIIIPYTESSNSSKKFKIEYIIEASNRLEALKKAEYQFNEYSKSTSASWIRIPDQSSIRVFRLLSDNSNNTEYTDELINQLPNTSKEKTLEILEKLEEIEDTTACSKIISLTKSEDPEIVAKAIYTLGAFCDPTCFFAVKNTYFQKENDKIKIAVVKTLLKLALPEDNVIEFYKTAINNPITRETVFEIKDSTLIPLCLSEIKNEQEFEKVCKNCLDIGEKALETLLNIEDTHLQNHYISRIIANLKTRAIDEKWKQWNEAEKKYNLL